MEVSNESLKTTFSTICMLNLMKNLEFSRKTNIAYCTSLIVNQLSNKCVDDEN